MKAQNADYERCPVVVDQQRGPGPGLFITCDRPLPCPNHPRHIGASGVAETQR